MNSDAFSKWVSGASEPELLQAAGRMAAALRRAAKPAEDRSRKELRQVREQLFRLERQARQQQVEKSTAQLPWITTCAGR